MSFFKKVEKFVDNVKIKQLVEKNQNHPVFGRDLDELLKFEQEEIPTVVQECISYLENNLQEKGLFRVKGVTAEVEKLKKLYREPNTRIDIDGEDVTPATVATLLKQYFRSLPRPVLSFSFYNAFLKIYHTENGEQRLNSIHRLVWDLPDSHRALLLYLLQFLKMVADKSAVNEMTAEALASCWGNLLLTTEGETEMIVMDSKNLTIVVRFLITEVETLSKKISTGNSIYLPKGASISALTAKAPNTHEEACGWLSKQGGSIKTWKRRWFILKDYVLFYYKSNSPADTAFPLGKIPIPSYLVGKADEVKKPFPFKLFHQGPCRIWYFSAESEQDREKWIRIIQESLKVLHNTNTKPAATQTRPQEVEEEVDPTEAANVDWAALNSVTTLKELRKYEKYIELEQKEINLLQKEIKFKIQEIDDEGALLESAKVKISTLLQQREASLKAANPPPEQTTQKAQEAIVPVQEQQAPPQQQAQKEETPVPQQEQQALPELQPQQKEEVSVPQQEETKQPEQKQEVPSSTQEQQAPPQQQQQKEEVSVPQQEETKQQAQVAVVEESSQTTVVAETPSSQAENKEPAQQDNTSTSSKAEETAIPQEQQQQEIKQEAQELQQQLQEQAQQ